MVGREQRTIKKQVSAQKLIEEINKPWAEYIKQDKLLNLLKKELKGDEVLLIMGAGNIYELTKTLLLSTGRS